jgi:hypothetical protein
MRLLISSEISAGLSCIAFSESAAGGVEAGAVEWGREGAELPGSLTIRR